MRANENNEKMTHAASMHHVDSITRGVLQEAPKFMYFYDIFGYRVQLSQNFPQLDALRDNAFSLGI